MAAVLRLLWNSDEHRLRSAWRLLLLALIFSTLTGIFFAGFGMLGGLVAALKLGFQEMIIDPQQLSYTLFQAAGIPVVLYLASGAASLLAALVSLAVCARWIDRRPISDYGFHFNRAWWRDLAFGLLLGLLLMAVIFTVEYLAGWVRVTGFFQPSGAGMPFWVEWLLWLVAFICVGFYEEVLLRGCLLRNLAEGLNLPPVGARLALLLAYLLSSVVFGSLHIFNPNATLASSLVTILAGLFLGLAFVLTGELAVPIGLHIAWNFSQGNLFGFSVSGINTGASLVTIQQNGPAALTGASYGPEAGLLGMVAILLGVVIIAWWLRRTRGGLNWVERLAVYLHIPPHTTSLT